MGAALARIIPAPVRTTRRESSGDTRLMYAIPPHSIRALPRLGLFPVSNQLRTLFDLQFAPSISRRFPVHTQGLGLKAWPQGDFWLVSFYYLIGLVALSAEFLFVLCFVWDYFQHIILDARNAVLNLLPQAFQSFQFGFKVICRNHCGEIPCNVFVRLFASNI